MIGKYKAFAAAAELKSLTRAAQRLQYTQSGISQLLRSLEDEIGFPLLVRGRLGAAPTPEGKQLLPYVQRMLAAAQDVQNMAADLRGAAAGTLQIGTFSSVAVNWLPKLLRGFAQEHPGVAIGVMNGTYSVVEDALSEGQIDCGFVTLPSREEFTVFPLARDRLMAVVGEESPLAALKEATAAQLADQPFIMPAEGYDYDIGKLFAAAGTAPNISFDIRDDFAAIAMVRQGLGITILPELMVKGLPLGGVRLIPIQGTGRKIGIAVSHMRYRAPAVKAFVEYVKVQI